MMHLSYRWKKGRKMVGFALFLASITIEDYFKFVQNLHQETPMIRTISFAKTIIRKGLWPRGYGVSFAIKQCSSQNLVNTIRSWVRFPAAPILYLLFIFFSGRLLVSFASSSISSGLRCAACALDLPRLFFLLRCARCTVVPFNNVLIQHTMLHILCTLYYSLFKINTFFFS